MSIASEIQDLSDNLDAAYAAIAEKGGQVPVGGGFNALADSIETITGGGPEPIPETQYGAVLVYNTLASRGVVDNTMDCTAEVVDNDLFMQFANAHPKPEWMGDEFAYRIQGSGSGSSWSWNCEIEMEYISIGTPEAIGLHITPNEEATWIEANIKVAVLPVPEEGTTWIELNDASAFAALGSSGDTKPVNGVAKANPGFKGVSIGSSITSTPESFMHKCNNLEILDMEGASALTTIGNSFLRKCTTFNQAVVLPSSVTSIGESFLRDCTTFNQDMALPSSVTSIGKYFLYGDTSFNGQIALPNGLLTIGDGFLTYASAFNQAVVFPDSVSSIGSNALSQCPRLNKKVVLPSRLQSLGGSFLYMASSFNQDIYFPGTLGANMGGILNSCHGYTSGTITLGDGITALGDNSFSGLGSSVGETLGNAKIVLPDTLTTIGNYVFYYARLGEEFTIPESVTTIGQEFLSRAYVYKTNLPAAVTTFPDFSRASIFSQMPVLQEIKLDADPTGITFRNDGFTLTSPSDSAASYVNGITVKGAHAADWKTALPDSAGTNRVYRKLILANS